LPVLKAIIALLQNNWGTTIEYLKLFLTYHLDSLKLLDDYEGSKKNENILVVNLASVRCLVSVGFSSDFMTKMYNFNNKNN
jgi:hypothetical protein